MAEHNILGGKGEDAAAEYLTQLGHQILTRNYRFGKKEIDIISKDANVVVFTEVKTRSSEYFGFPEESVNYAKRKNLQRAAEEYLYRNKLDAEVRFDVVSIVREKEELKIHHIKDAFS